MVGVFPAAPMRGVGRTGGFKFMVEDRGDAGPRRPCRPRPTTSARQGDQLRKARNSGRCWSCSRTSFAPTRRSCYVDVNRAQCMTMGVPLADVFNTLQIYLGSLYVNDFNLFGRTWQVIVQADAQFRNQVGARPATQGPQSRAAMVPLGALADVREVNGPLVLTRYNMYPAAADQRQHRPGDQLPAGASS